jgi:WD40 repeat protein
MSKLAGCFWLMLFACVSPLVAGQTATLPRGAVIRLGDATSKHAVTCVAVSPDGNLIAAASADGTARLCSRATGKSLHRFEVNTEPVWNAAFSFDGKILALAHQRGGISIWDVRTGKLQRRIEHAYPVYSLAFTPDDGFLAAETGDPDAIGLWDWRTGKTARNFERFNPLSRSVAVSPNGQLLAAAGKQTLHVWDLQENKLVLGRQNFDFSVTFSHGGALIALAGDHWVTIANSATGKKLAQLRADGNPRGSRSVAFGPDGLTVAGSHGKNVRLWEVPGRRQLHEFEGHAGLVTSVAFTPDGKALVSGSEDGTAIVWDLALVRDKSDKTRVDVQGQFDLLKDRDFLIAYGAFCRLRVAPKETLQLLEKHLDAATKVPADGFTQLIKNLDAPAFAIRNRAMEELKRYGVAAEHAVRNSRQGNGKLETMRRIDDLLNLLEAEWPRSQWCVTLLEEMRESRARELLTQLSKGDPDCRLTRIAALALARKSK